MITITLPSWLAVMFIFAAALSFIGCILDLMLWKIRKEFFKVVYKDMED